MKDNPRVFLPKPRPPGEERIMATKDVLREEAIQSYMKENCNQEGFQKACNLTKQQKRGCQKLIARTKAGEIVINETDKSGNMSVSSRENYSQQGRPKIEKDQPVT